jgi:hypothetical protein
MISFLSRNFERFIAHEKHKSRDRQPRELHTLHASVDSKHIGLDKESSSKIKVKVGGWDLIDWNWIEAKLD